MASVSPNEIVLICNASLKCKAAESLMPDIFMASLGIAEVLKRKVLNRSTAAKPSKAIRIVRKIFLNMRLVCEGIKIG